MNNKIELSEAEKKWLELRVNKSKEIDKFLMKTNIKTAVFNSKRGKNGN